MPRTSSASRASPAPTWTIGSSGGAVKSTAEPVAAGRELGADYAVTGDVESGGDALRVTLHVDDVHSGAQVWSQTLSPILEEAKSGAAEDELAGRAGSLMNETIMVGEQRRAQAKDDRARTTYDCVVLGLELDNSVEMISDAPSAQRNHRQR